MIHGEFATVADRWTLAPDAYEWVRDRFAAGTVGGAGVWLQNSAGEVLLVRNEGTAEWAEPGGKHEPGESLAETARRELAEEAGVNCSLTGVALVQIVEMVEPTRPPIVRLIVVFDGTYTGGTPRPEPGEIAEVRWWDDHPESVRYSALTDLEIPATE